MHDTTAIVGSFLALAILAFVYYSNILTRPESWLRGETIGMFSLALFTGFFSMAIAAEITWVSAALSENTSVAVLMSDGSDMISIATIAVTLLLFRHLVKAINRRNRSAADAARLATGLGASAPATGLHGHAA